MCGGNSKDKHHTLWEQNGSIYDFFVLMLVVSDILKILKDKKIQQCATIQQAHDFGSVCLAN